MFNLYAKKTKYFTLERQNICSDVMNIVVVAFGLFRGIGINSGLTIEKHYVKPTPFSYTNHIMIVWNLYPVLAVVKTVFSETNQLDTLKRATLKSVEHASKFTVLMFTITK